MPQLVWLITGCSSGFGDQLVREALGRGDLVIATARGDRSRLKELEELGAKTISIDVSAAQAELNAKVEEAIAMFGRIDVLVNNAGFFQAGIVEEMTNEDYMSVFGANYFGAINMTRAVLPHLRERKSGFVAFIGSPLSWHGAPGASPYCSTKYAITGLYESLKGEIAAFGIKSIIFDAGRFRTAVFEPERIKYCNRKINDYTEIINGLAGYMDSLNNAQVGDPKKGAKLMVDVIRGEGAAAGKELPLRLPMGSDILEEIRQKCKDTLAICDEWEKEILSTDFD